MKRWVKDIPPPPTPLLPPNTHKHTRRSLLLMEKLGNGITEGSSLEVINASDLQTDVWGTPGVHRGTN